MLLHYYPESPQDEVDFINPLSGHDFNDRLAAAYDFRWQGGHGARELKSGRVNGSLVNGTRWAPSCGRPDGQGTLRFDASDDYVDCGTVVTIPPRSMAFEAWFRPTTLDGTVRYICGVQNSGSDGYRAIRIDTSNRIEFAVIGSATKTATGPTLTAGRWYHVLGALDLIGQVVRIYVDGELFASTSTSGVTFSGSLSNFKIGCRPDLAGSNAFGGEIGVVRVLYRAPVAHEAKLLYAERLAGSKRLYNWIPYFADVLPGAAAPGGSKPFFYNRYVVGRRH